jgi:predicted HicB family RNase H-like nuclease
MTPPASSERPNVPLDAPKRALGTRIDETSWRCHYDVMLTSSFIEALQADLSTFASLGEESTTRAASQIATALGPAIRVRLLDAVAEVASELSSQLPEGQVEVRLEGGDPVLVYVEDSPAPRPAPGEEAAEARITLRLPESLKSRVEAAAARDRTSINGWLVQAIARSLESRARRIGSRFTGYARS